ncbi:MULTISPECIES: hypothetical protein [unclassified Nocardioides]|uniref:hypothetical protein n=1 Tax=unclassified Nocardioides TaxID=2615069 RepID=UPI000491D6B4|nr:MULTISPECIES: hypothetical protein [unclassified Nocardioides]
MSLITIDQIISGASNVIVALLSAHLLGVEAFGYFGLLIIILSVGLGVTRSLVGDPVMVHPDDARERPGAPIGAALIVGTAMGVAFAVVALVLFVTDLPLAAESLVVAIGIPALLLHDLGRYLGFATQRPSYSLVLDTVWLVLIAVAMTTLVLLDEVTLLWFVVAWVGTGATAATLVFVQHGPPARGGLAWLRERWPYSWRFLMSFTALQGAAAGFSVIVAAVAGARALGAVRGALLLIRPYVTFQTAAVAAGVAEVANAGKDGPPSGTLRRTTLIATAIGAVNGALLLVVPDSVGRIILSDTWEATEPLLVPACVQILCLGLIVGPRAHLTGMRRISTVVRLDITATFGIVALGVVGVFVDGAVGAYWGTAAGQAVAAVAWWIAVSAVRGPAGDPEGTGGTTGDGGTSGAEDTGPAGATAGGPPGSENRSPA